MINNQTEFYLKRINDLIHEIDLNGRIKPFTRPSDIIDWSIDENTTDADLRGYVRDFISDCYTEMAEDNSPQAKEDYEENQMYIRYMGS